MALPSPDGSPPVGLSGSGRVQLYGLQAEAEGEWSSCSRSFELLHHPIGHENEV